MTATALAFCVAMPANAEEEAKASPEVLERDSEGRAAKVRLGEKTYSICTPEVTDGCINPRAAGLDQGNRQIDYWPGKPVSQIDGPLPEHSPQEGEAGEAPADSGSE